MQQLRCLRNGTDITEIIKMPLINLHFEEHIDLIKPLEAQIVLYTNRGCKDWHFQRQTTSDKGQQTNSKKEGKSRLLFQQNMESTENSKLKLQFHN